MHRIGSGLTLVVAALTLGACNEDSLEPDVSEIFEATLSGANEIPVRDSNATGTAAFELNTNKDELRYRLTANSLQGFTQAHIHQGDATVNGPIVVFLFGPHGAPGVNVPMVLKTGTIREQDLNPQNFQGSFEDFLDEIRAGNMYVNAHTTTFPAGEIRGQVEEGS